MGPVRAPCAATAWPSRPPCAPHAPRPGEDEELWGVVGLLHDMDYERYPDLETPATRGWRWPSSSAAARRRRSSARSPRTPTSWASRARRRLEKTLYAVDELSGFLVACAYVRPEGIHGLTPKSVKKKLKQPSFAAAVNRDEVRAGRRGARRRLRRARALRHRRARGARGRAGPRRRREPAEPPRCRRLSGRPRVGPSATRACSARPTSRRCWPPRSSRACRSASTRSRSCCSCASETGSYAAAGRGRRRAFALGGAVGAPLVGRLVDRHGQRAGAHAARGRRTRRARRARRASGCRRAARACSSPPAAPRASASRRSRRVMRTLLGPVARRRRSS